MRIAQIPPLYEAVPPRRYGGTERIVSYLVEELVRRGHEVTVFGTGDSKTSARLVPVCKEALHFDQPQSDPAAYHVLQLGLAYACADEFDIIHAHVDFRAMAFADMVRTPTVSTNHNRLDSAEAVCYMQTYPSALVTTLSNSQARQLQGGKWLGTVYNGIPVEQFPFRPHPGDYLAYLGRMSPEKGLDVAIRVAQLAGIPLRIGAKINAHERDYFEQVIQPLMKQASHVELVGEVADEEKADLVGGALAVLMPVRWPEPFGLAAIEAMACGTPVLACPAGALPEVVEHGVTGYLAATAEDLAAYCQDVDKLDRRACRRRVEQLFSVQTMVDGYEDVYRRVLRDTRRLGHQPLLAS